MHPSILQNAFSFHGQPKFLLKNDQRNQSGQCSSSEGPSVAALTRRVGDYAVSTAGSTELFTFEIHGGGVCSGEQIPALRGAQCAASNSLLTSESQPRGRLGAWCLMASCSVTSIRSHRCLGKLPGQPRPHLPLISDGVYKPSLELDSTSARHLGRTG